MKDKMSKKPKERRNIAEEVQPVGKYVVMRHSSRTKSMHCSAVHDSKPSAVKEAQRLCAEDIGRNGPGDTCYYVLMIVSQVGIIDDKLSIGV